MKNVGKTHIGAVAIVITLVCSALFLPLTGAVTQSVSKSQLLRTATSSPVSNDPLKLPDPTRAGPEGDKIYLDTFYNPEEEVALAEEQNDIGYHTDVKNNIVGSLYIYVGEPVDQTVPGRGRTAMLDPANGDDEDWYRFSVCEGQSIQESISTSQNYAAELCDVTGSPVGNSYTADATGFYFLHVYANDGAGTGDYTINLALSGQNDAGIGGDAGDTIQAATPLTPGEYTGYMESSDVEDWYSFQANTGQGINVRVEPLERSDYDIHLYNPSGELVYSAMYYGEDTLEYPADASGTWKIKLDMFPGWDASKWPDNYFLYGSGAYELDLAIGGTAEAPVGPIPQPNLTPVANTFIVNDDPTSNKDEYAYLAAVPAANYMENDMHYASPIVYQGCDDITTWFTTVDQTTQYLLDDWNTYLSRHGVEPTEYTLAANPVQAAADIATSCWTSSDTAVLTVDGSGFTDSIQTVMDKDVSMVSLPDITSVPTGSSQFKDFGGESAVPMFLGKQWGAIHLLGIGDNFAGDTGLITPRYEIMGEDFWPYPYDFNGPDMDTFYPVTKAGLWFPFVTTQSGLDELQIIKYKGDRYTIPVSSTDSSIKVTISNGEPSNLIIYLIDPQGNLRAPAMPHYNGGEIQPIHYWNGGHWQHNYDEFRTMILEPHSDYSVEIHYPTTGQWTAIVVPYLSEDLEDVGFEGSYHITAEIRSLNADRTAAALSGANAAVLASSNHVPLLYVTPDAIPSETTAALTQLGVSKIIYVNIDDVSSASPTGTVTTYHTLQEVVNAIKAESASENFITITSLGSGDGYFAPAAMAAAYHVSPVLSIGEAPEAYDTLGKAATWREYGSDADYYHGSRALGHLPSLTEPFVWQDALRDLIQNHVFPAPGFDLKLRWYSKINQGITGLAQSYGLDLPGKEAYLFVAPRDTDIRDIICRAMTGNLSFAGQIPVPTTAWSSAIVVRNVLYSALIYANPGRDVTTSQMMNFPDGGQWTTNDGTRTSVYSSRQVKASFSSHGRFFEGHCLWDNLLERYNEGASICYYSGHGTGGSGISAQYENVNEQFPLAELTHEDLRDFTWWDAWRGYMYDDAQTKSTRWGGFTWYNAKEPNLYDIIHFKWVDQLFDNLHSIVDLWMSCTTASHLGPMVYLAHGAVVYYGNGGTGLCPQEDLLDDQWIHAMLVDGKSIGDAMSDYVWLHQRDYTTMDPIALYGRSSNQLTNTQMIFGDPTLIVYSPEWTEPTPLVP
jgi:hypothetical protein